jgi:hypothetical protein
METHFINGQFNPHKKMIFATAGILIFLLLLVLTLYTALHEGGHALTGLIFGGKITSFNVNFLNLSAHAGIRGDFTSGEQSLISIAGMLLPLMLFTAIFFLSPGKKEPVIEWFKLILFLAAVNSLLAWIVIPLMTLAGRTIADDAANFVRYSGLPPWLVALFALLVYAACLVLLLQHHHGVRHLFQRFSSLTLDLSHPDTQRNLLTLGFLAASSLTIIFSLKQVFPTTSLDIPAGYQLVSELHPFEDSINEQPVYSFTLNRPTSVSFYILLENIKGAPADIHLSGPSGYDKVLFIEQDPQADIVEASVNPRNMPLEKGDYVLWATFPSSPGSVRVYIKLE